MLQEPLQSRISRRRTYDENEVRKAKLKFMAVEGRIAPIIDSPLMQKGGSEDKHGIVSDSETNSNVRSVIDRQFSETASRDKVEAEIQPLISGIEVPPLATQASDADPQENAPLDQGGADEKDDFSDSDSEKGAHESERVNEQVLNAEMPGNPVVYLGTSTTNGDIIKGPSIDSTDRANAGDYILTARTRKRLIRSVVSSEEDIEDSESTVIAESYENAKYVQVNLIDTKAAVSFRKPPTAEKAIQVFKILILFRYDILPFE